MPSNLPDPVDSRATSSYFLRVSKQGHFRYDSAWPELFTTNERMCARSIMRLGTESKVRVEAIPTGAINLDAAIGVGGIPRGRVTEIYGPESSGKTTLSLHVVANAQRAGGVAAYIDAEHALDTEYARKLGVDVENLLISQPDTGEQGLEIADILVRSGAIDVVVIDSVAALVPKAEIEGDMGDSHVGLQARLMSQFSGSAPHGSSCRPSLRTRSDGRHATRLLARGSASGRRWGAHVFQSHRHGQWSP